MSSSRRPVKISGKVENSKDLKEAFKGSADIVVFDPSAKKVVGSAKLERDTFELSTDIVAENMRANWSSRRCRMPRTRPL